MHQRGEESSIFGQLPADTVRTVTANGLVMGMLAYAYLLVVFAADYYYLSVQEDEYVEWASFWAFLGASVLFLLSAVRQRRRRRNLPWFLAGLALFCFVVAMEEISWGQRVIGYRPPVYFLEHNFQQELNLHNVVDTSLRKLGLKVIILGYGVVLPLAALVPSMGRWLNKLGIVAPPAAMIPAFLAVFVTYQIYPWKHSGEWVELMLGLAFLFVALAGPEEQDERPGMTAPALTLVIGWLVVMVLGASTAAASRIYRNALPETVDAARQEIEALRVDFEARRVTSRCGLHKRLYTYVQKYEQTYLLEGVFAGLKAQGLPKERADFFLDPWNSPYWVRDSCPTGSQKRQVFVYSFGPNRKRESSRSEIRGDDVGVFIVGVP